MQFEQNNLQFGHLSWTISYLDFVLGLRTAGLEDKATACEMLVCYARELKSSFSPYIEPVTELMLQHLNFMFHNCKLIHVLGKLLFILFWVVN